MVMVVMRPLMAVEREVQKVNHLEQILFGVAVVVEVLMHPQLKAVEHLHMVALEALQWHLDRELQDQRQVAVAALRLQHLRLLALALAVSALFMFIQRKEK
jgi:hypothetical protein